MVRCRVRAVLAAVLTAVVLSTAVVPARGAPAVVDGSTQSRAAASCWEIKQRHRASASGVYWLRTPALQAPERFFCDMTTDGGGWVLVGRGRTGWLWGGDAQGTPAQVAAAVTGPAAFSPRHLSNRMIDALFDGRRLDSFPDHVRLRRATSTRGTTWQESRLMFHARDRWSWAFGAGHPLTRATVAGTTVRGITTRDIAVDQGYRRIWTFESSVNGWHRGFTFGSAGRGSPAASSYVYAATDRGGYGTPFTQVFVRPRLRTEDLKYDRIADQGTPAQAVRPLARSGAIPTMAGVSGLGAGGSGELATAVQAFAQIGSTMYVGGNFTTVHSGPGGPRSTGVAQAYLAAFDASTGAWIAGFRPRIDGQVKALVALPDGRLAIGGEFARVGGDAHAGFAVVDAVTGRPADGWDVQVQNRLAGGRVSVRALDVGGGRVYLGGAFTQLVHGRSAVFARSAGRLALATQRPDAGWTPQFNGTVTGLDVSDAGGRAYFSGYFTRSGSTPTSRAAALRTGVNATVVSPRWSPTFSTAGEARYQQAVRQVGPWVWLAGSQHSLFAYDTTRFRLRAAHISRDGGDFQALTSRGSIVYGGCHCGDWNYAGSSDYDTLRPGRTPVAWSQADKLSFVGAWDAATGRFLPEFAPQWKADRGRGAWALQVGVDGTLWAGGSFTSVVREDGRTQWAGGFARFAPRPSAPPPRPQRLSASLARGVATLTWSPGGATSRFEVLRNDRVVATTTASSIRMPESVAGDRFFVRATDGRGNRSASTVVAVAR